MSKASSGSDPDPLAKPGLSRPGTRHDQTAPGLMAVPGTGPGSVRLRISKEPDVRRQEIVDTACRMFASRGIGKTAMADIASQMGVAKSLVYYYFSSKDELVTAVISHIVSGVEAALRQIIEADDLDFHHKLSAFLDVYLSAIHHHPALLVNPRTDPGLLRLIRDRLSATALEQAGLLLDQRAAQGLIRIDYPEYMLKILIRGLGDLYLEGIQDPQILAVLIDQTLGTCERV